MTARTGIALAYLDGVQDRVFFCALTRRPVHLDTFKEIAV